MKEPEDYILANAEKIMKRCQVGTRNYDEANSLHAECYGVIGTLKSEVEQLRKERERKRHQEEDTDLHRAIHRLQSEQAEKIRQSEEAGYNKGLQDVMALKGEENGG